MQYVHCFCLRLNYGFVYYSFTPIIQKEIPFKGTVIVMQRWQCPIHNSTPVSYKNNLQNKLHIIDQIKVSRVLPQTL